MTEKELLYVEDALGHEQYFQTHCSELIQRIQDNDLKCFAERAQQQHCKIFSRLYELL